MSFIFHCRQLSDPIDENWGTEDELGFLIQPNHTDVPVVLSRESGDPLGTEGGCFGTGYGKNRQNRNSRFHTCGMTGVFTLQGSLTTRTG